MAANKVINIQPAALAAAAANVLNCAITSVAGPIGMAASQPYLLVKHIRVTNNDTVAHPLNLYKGLTGGSAVGTELARLLNVPADTVLDVYYGVLRLDSTDFITGFSDGANKPTFTFDAEIGFA